MGCIAFPTPPRLRNIVAANAQLDMSLRNEDELAKIHNGLERDKEYLPTYFDGKRLYDRVLAEVKRRQQP